MGNADQNALVSDLAALAAQMNACVSALSSFPSKGDASCAATVSAALAQVQPAAQSIQALHDQLDGFNGVA